MQKSSRTDRRCEKREACENKCLCQKFFDVKWSAVFQNIWERELEGRFSLAGETQKCRIKVN